MKTHYRLWTTDHRRSHELKTLGGLISPVWAVAEDALGSVRGTLPEDVEHQLQHVRVEAKALLERVVKKSAEKHLEELDADTFNAFYHQHFIAWQSLLDTFVRLLDQSMTSTSHLFADPQKIHDMTEKLRTLLDIEERDVSSCVFDRDMKGRGDRYRSPDAADPDE